jgi:hypothetical protein
MANKVLKAAVLSASYAFCANGVWSAADPPKVALPVGTAEVPNPSSTSPDVIKASQYDKSSQSVRISASVRCIDDSAFKEYPNLREVIFEPGSKLERIGYKAFCSCTQLQSINIPASVEVIGNGAFWRCLFLKAVNFAPACNLTTIGRSAFATSSIESIQI